MTIGEGIAYSTFWICLCTVVIAYIRKPKHKHKWVETMPKHAVCRSRDPNDVVGYTNYCKCEECGEHKSFFCPVGG